MSDQVGTTSVKLIETEEGLVSKAGKNPVFDDLHGDHRRSNLPARHTTVVEHMPRPHREYAEWTHKRLIDWARQSGPHTAQLVSHILSSRRHPQQGFRSCLGILRLAKTYSKERLEAACHRALTIGATTYKSVESILKHNLDSQPLPKPAASSLPITHDNLRGPDYFH